MLLRAGHDTAVTSEKSNVGLHPRGKGPRVVHPNCIPLDAWATLSFPVRCELSDRLAAHRAFRLVFRAVGESPAHVCTL